MSFQLSKEFATQIIEKTPHLVYIYDVIQEKPVFANKRLVTHFGYQEQDLEAFSPETFKLVFHPDEQDLLLEDLRKMKNLKPDESVTTEYRLKGRDGQWCWVRDTFSAFQCDENGKALLVMGIISNIDEEKRTKLALEHAFSKLNFCLEASHLGLWEWNPSNNEFTWDQRMYELHSMPYVENEPYEALTKRMMERITQEERLQIRETLLHASKRNKEVQLSYKIRLGSDSTRTIHLSGQTVEESGTQKFFGVAWDEDSQLHSQKVIQEQEAVLLNSAKMAALGEMSAGIAHEINNPLTVIQARSFQLTQLAELNKLEPEKIKQIADSVSKTADKIAKIIKSLRTFARDGSQDPFHIVSVKDLVDNTLELCKTRFYNAGIQLDVAEIDEELEIECRTIQIEQVLLNLLNNSFDAVQNKPEKWIRLSVQQEEDYIKIFVEDSGGPIPPDISKKIMLPFFTTKEVGKGTGLGLSISSGIVKNHQGEFYYDEKALCTRFVIQLPYFQINR